MAYFALTYLFIRILDKSSKVLAGEEEFELVSLEKIYKIK